jgi:hypothetical protein
MHHVLHQPGEGHSQPTHRGWFVASRDYVETSAQRSSLLGAMLLNCGIKGGEDVLPNLVHC